FRGLAAHTDLARQDPALAAPALGHLQALRQAQGVQFGPVATRPDHIAEARETERVGALARDHIHATTKLPEIDFMHPRTDGIAHPGSKGGKSIHGLISLMKYYDSRVEQKHGVAAPALQSLKTITQGLQKSIIDYIPGVGTAKR